MTSKILITPRSLTRDGHPSLQRLEEAGYQVVFSRPGVQPTEEDLLNLVYDCVGYLAGVEPVTSKVIHAARQLRVISRNGTGIDNIDLQAAEKQGIRVRRALGANARGVAELTIGLFFSLARSIPYSDANLKQDAWQRRKGFEVEGKTLGLIGYGKIGGLVGAMASALGMIPITYDPVPGQTTAASPKIQRVSLDDLCRQSDIISLHCPSQPGKKAVIDARALEMMKRGVYLVNTARADLVETAAILSALESGQVAGMAVDVYEQEPPVDRRLVMHDRVIATPHVGGFTDESVDRATGEAVENLLEVLASVS